MDVVLLVVTTLSLAAAAGFGGLHVFFGTVIAVNADRALSVGGRGVHSWVRVGTSRMYGAIRLSSVFRSASSFSTALPAMLTTTVAGLIATRSCLRACSIGCKSGPASMPSFPLPTTAPTTPRSITMQ